MATIAQYEEWRKRQEERRQSRGESISNFVESTLPQVENSAGSPEVTPLEDIPNTKSFWGGFVSGAKDLGIEVYGTGKAVGADIYNLASFRALRGNEIQSVSAFGRDFETPSAKGARGGTLIGQGQVRQGIGVAAEGALDVVSTLWLGGGAAVKGANAVTKTAGKATVKGTIKNIRNGRIVGSVIDGGKVGSIYGAAYGATSSLQKSDDEFSIGTFAKDTALGGAIGFAAGGALAGFGGVAGKATSKATSKARGATSKISEAASKLYNRPASARTSSWSNIVKQSRKDTSILSGKMKDVDEYLASRDNLVFISKKTPVSDIDGANLGYNISVKNGKQFVTVSENAPQELIHKLTGDYITRNNPQLIQRTSDEIIAITGGKAPVDDGPIAIMQVLTNPDVRKKAPKLTDELQALGIKLPGEDITRKSKTMADARKLKGESESMGVDLSEETPNPKKKSEFEQEAIDAEVETLKARKEALLKADRPALANATKELTKLSKKDEDLKLELEKLKEEGGTAARDLTKEKNIELNDAVQKRNEAERKLDELQDQQAQFEEAKDLVKSTKNDVKKADTKIEKLEAEIENLQKSNGKEKDIKTREETLRKTKVQRDLDVIRNREMTKNLEKFDDVKKEISSQVNIIKDANAVVKDLNSQIDDVQKNVIARVEKVQKAINENNIKRNLAEEKVAKLQAEPATISEKDFVDRTKKSVAENIDKSIAKTKTSIDKLSSEIDTLMTSRQPGAFKEARKKRKKRDGIERELTLLRKEKDELAEGKVNSEQLTELDDINKRLEDLGVDPELPPVKKTNEKEVENFEQVSEGTQAENADGGQKQKAQEPNKEQTQKTTKIINKGKKISDDKMERVRSKLEIQDKAELAEELPKNRDVASNKKDRAAALKLAQEDPKLLDDIALGKVLPEVGDLDRQITAIKVARALAQDAGDWKKVRDLDVKDVYAGRSAANELEGRRDLGLFGDTQSPVIIGKVLDRRIDKLKYKGLKGVEAKKQAMTELKEAMQTSKLDIRKAESLIDKLTC